MIENNIFVFLKKYPAFTSQLELITYDDVGSIATLQTILHSNAILVCSREYAELVRNHYFTVPFHISREGYISSNGNYAIRKSLDAKKKNRLSRL